MTGTLYTIGYRGLSPAQLSMLLPAGAHVVDVRLRRWSGYKPWSHGIRKTIEDLGFRYTHQKGLGNKAYRTGGIELLDPSRVEDIVRYLAEGDVALLCACADPDECHRMVITQKVRHRLPGLKVEHRTKGESR